MKKARKGFTLVELLIVVAIMGILSVSMMMAGSKGTKKAEVAKVATGISTIGNAVQLFISVSGDSDLSAQHFIDSASGDYVSLPYLSHYTVSRDSTGWYVSFDVSKAPLNGDGDAISFMKQVSEDNNYTGTKGLRVYF